MCYFLEVMGHIGSQNQLYHELTLFHRQGEFVLVHKAHEVAGMHILEGGDIGISKG